MNVRINSEVRTCAHSWDNRRYSKNVDSPWIRSRSLLSQICNAISRPRPRLSRFWGRVCSHASRGFLFDSTAFLYGRLPDVCLTAFFGQRIAHPFCLLTGFPSCPCLWAPMPLNPHCDGYTPTKVGHSPPGHSPPSYIWKGVLKQYRDI